MSITPQFGSEGAINILNANSAIRLRFCFSLYSCLKSLILRESLSMEYFVSLISLYSSRLFSNYCRVIIVVFIFQKLNLTAFSRTAPLVSSSSACSGRVRCSICRGRTTLLCLRPANRRNAYKFLLPYYKMFFSCSITCSLVVVCCIPSRSCRTFSAAVELLSNLSCTLLCE